MNMRPTPFPQCLLSGHLPLYRAESHDYPWREAIQSFLPVVDEFLILCPEQDEDGTAAAVREFAGEHEKVVVHYGDWWQPARRSDCLADATNYLIERCRGKYHLSVQADEVLHENQAASLRGIAENGSWQWALFGRLNFFGSFDVVNMNRGRWPSDVVRLARTDLYPNLRSYGDATHLGYLGKDYSEARYPRLDARDVCSWWHYAYVRKPGAYLKRQAEMAALYQFGEDPRLVACREAGIVDWFGIVPRSEFVPTPGPHPKIIQPWIEARRECVASGVIE